MDASDQMGCRLKDESTTPPYQRRPRTASGTSAVSWPPNRGTAFGASGVIPRMGRHDWDRGGLDDSRLLSTGSYSSPPERAQSLGLLFISEPTVRRLKPPLQIGQKDHCIFIYFNRKPFRRPNTTLMYPANIAIASIKGNRQFAPTICDCKAPADNSRHAGSGNWPSGGALR